MIDIGLSTGVCISVPDLDGLWASVLECSLGWGIV